MRFKSSVPSLAGPILLLAWWKTPESSTHSRRLSIIRKLQHVNHVGSLLFQDVFPRVIGKIFQCGTHCIMVIFPTDTFQNRIRLWQWLQLEFWRLVLSKIGSHHLTRVTNHWEVISCQDLGGLFLLLRVSFPFNVSFPARTLFREVRHIALLLESRCIRFRWSHFEGAVQGILGPSFY